ncbi:MAG TPA: hypothetical protein VK827_03550 [Lysobacter sp.]|nr:hypothetical protein [Lysobacter sp.]
MKCLNPTAALLLALGASAIALGGCRAEKTQEGELPEVDVTAEGGQMPEYEVETADVDVGTREETVTVPDVDVTMPDEQPEQEQKPDEGQ